MLSQYNLFPMRLPQVKDAIRCTTPEDFANLIMDDMRWLNQEEFWVLALNSHNLVIAKDMVYKGSLTGCVVHPREIFRFAVLNNAAAIVVAHNHPSGDCRPSKEDDNVTQTLVSAGKVMGIPLLDHIVIGDNQYFSYQEEGRM